MSTGRRYTAGTVALRMEDVSHAAAFFLHINLKGE